MPLARGALPVASFESPARPGAASHESDAGPRLSFTMIPAMIRDSPAQAESQRLWPGVTTGASPGPRPADSERPGRRGAREPEPALFSKLLLSSLPRGRGPRGRSESAGRGPGDAPVMACNNTLGVSLIGP